MVFKILIILIVFLTNVEAKHSGNLSLSWSQKETLRKVYREASKYRSKTGHTFNDTMVAICLTETSGGENVIGDSYFTNGSEKHLFLRSLGVNQTKLGTAIRVIKKYKLKLHNRVNKDAYSFNKYIPILNKITKYQKLVKRFKRYKGKRKKWARHNLRWAQAQLKKARKKMRKYRKNYRNDNIIVSKLISDVSFNTSVAVHYLMLNFNRLKYKKMKRYFTTISLYNGGYHNRGYFKRVKTNLKRWYKIKKQILRKKK